MVTRLIEDRFCRQVPGAAHPELDEAQNLIGPLGFRNTGFSIAEHALRGIASQEDQHASRPQAAAGNVVLFQRSGGGVGRHGVEVQMQRGPVRQADSFDLLESGVHQMQIGTVAHARTGGGQVGPSGKQGGARVKDQGP